MTETAILSLLLAAGSAAAEPAGSFEFRAPTGTVSIGAPLALEAVARFPDRFSLSFEPAGQETKPVQLLDARLGAVESAGGRKEQRVAVTVAAFELGVVTLPELSWTLTAPDGTRETLRSPPVRFESVGPEPDPGDPSEIRDIRGPLGLPWWAVALPVAALAAAIVGAWWWRRGRGTLGAPSPRPEDKRLPHERALDELRRLRQEEPPPKEFYIRLTDILRQYFEGRFGVSASVLTTSDLLRRLREVEIDRSTVARCREVFERSDLVKFARRLPSAGETLQDCADAERVVNETAPKPPPEPAAAPPSFGTRSPK
ncbi:MAG: DUF4381 family protein [Elusimicrobia bacterium]|nr:DUF4381 family protein [Elusimicrobiota bacterium]